MKKSAKPRKAIKGTSVKKIKKAGVKRIKKVRPIDAVAARKAASSRILQAHLDAHERAMEVLEEAESRVKATNMVEATNKYFDSLHAAERALVAAPPGHPPVPFLGCPGQCLADRPELDVEARQKYNLEFAKARFEFGVASAK